VLKRHGRFDAAGLGRVVAPGGQLLTFHDIGAVVYQLRMVSWQGKDFTVARYDEAPRRLHARIEADGSFAVPTHRFLVRAAKRG